MKFVDLLDQLKGLINERAENPAVQKLDSRQLVAVLDSYSPTAVQRMVIARGLGNRKATKMENISILAKTFYNEQSVQHAIDNLTPLAKEALARIAMAGGAITVGRLKEKLAKTNGTNAGEKAIPELVGSLLALYAQRNSMVLEFSGGYGKHELHAPNFYSWNNQNDSAIVWSPPQILELYKIPKNIAQKLQPPLLSPYKGAEPKITHPARLDNLMADILTFTRYIEQNKVKILQSGDVGKRDYVKIAEQLVVKDYKDPKQSAKISQLGRTYFLWTLLDSMGFIDESDDNFAYTAEEDLIKFYAMPRFQQVRMMILGWIESDYNDFLHIPTLDFTSTSTYNTTIPDRHQSYKAREFLINLFQKAFSNGEMKGDWYSLEQLKEGIRDTDEEFLLPRLVMYYGDYGAEYYNGYISNIKPKVASKQWNANLLKRPQDWMYVEGEWIVHILAEALTWLGVTEVGVDVNNCPVAFRFTPLGLSVFEGADSAEEKAMAKQLQDLAEKAPELAKPLIVQPNFDVMILAPLQNLPLLRQIDRFASQASMGDVAMYRISKESVLRGMRGGLDGETLINLLNEHSRVPLAQNVATSLRDWNAEYERVVMRRNVNLLEMPTAAELDKLLENPQVAKQLVKRLSPTMALLGDNFNEVIKWIKAPREINVQDLNNSMFSFTSPYHLEIKAKSAHPYTFYIFGKFADLESWKPEKLEAVFKLTPESMARAERNGLNATTILSNLRLRLIQKGALPPETVLAVNGWLGNYNRQGEIKIERAITLQAPHSIILDDIFNVPRFREALISRASPTVALIRESDFAKLQTELEKLGITVKNP
jgi:hypothetical protein